MPNPSRRIIVIVTIVVLVAATLAWSLRPQPVPADFAPVLRGDLLVGVEDEGETRVKDVYVISAPVAGRVLRTEIKVGDETHVGKTVLATFEPSDPAIPDLRTRSEAEAEVRAAEAAVELSVAERDRVAAELAFARTELRRREQLAARGTISASDIERARLEVDRTSAAQAEALARVKVRRGQLDRARAVLITARATGSPGAEYATDERFVIAVRAPVRGRVLRVMHESETVVAAGTPILAVGDQSRLEIVVDLLSSDAVKVSEGDRVIVEAWGGDRPLAGVVRRVEPFGFTKISALGIEERRVNVIIDLTSPREQWAALGHGYRVAARIITDERLGVLKIPVSALFRSEGNWSVFVNRDGVARLQTIELGKRNPLEAEVRSGLDPGELVILHPSDRIGEGVPVEARPADKNARSHAKST